MPVQNFQQYVFWLLQLANRLNNASVPIWVSLFPTSLLCFADRFFVPSGMLCLSLIIRRWSWVICSPLQTSLPLELYYHMMHKRKVHLGTIRAHAGQIIWRTTTLFYLPIFFVMPNWLGYLSYNDETISSQYCFKVSKIFKVLIHTLMEEVIQFSICKEQTPILFIIRACTVSQSGTKFRSLY